jgi:hypothetical protein
MLQFFLLKNWTFFTKEPHDLALMICKKMSYYQTSKGMFVINQDTMTDRETGHRYVYFLLNGEWWCTCSVVRVVPTQW